MIRTHRSNAVKIVVHSAQNANAKASQAGRNSTRPGAQIDSRVHHFDPLWPRETLVILVTLAPVGDFLRAIRAPPFSEMSNDRLLTRLSFGERAAIASKNSRWMRSASSNTWSQVFMVTPTLFACSCQPAPSGDKLWPMRIPL